MKRQIAALALVLAACGKAPDSQPQAAADSVAAQVPVAPAGPKACELVSADEIQRATGVAVQAGKTTSDYAGDSQCRFRAVTDTAGAVMVTLHQIGKITPYEKVPGSFVVEGIGDKAVWNPAVSQLAVASGDAVFSISFLSMPAKQSWATPLARAALGKLQP